MNIKILNGSPKDVEREIQRLLDDGCYIERLTQSSHDNNLIVTIIYKERETFKPAPKFGGNHETE